MTRKRAALILVALIAAATRLGAQDKTLLFGVKGGYDSGQQRAVEGEQGFEVDKISLSGASFGAFAAVRLSRVFSVVGEVLYFDKGGAYDVRVPIDIPGVSVTVHDERRLSYVEVPVLVKLSVPLSRAVRPTFLTGPSVGFNLKAELRSDILVQVPGVRLELRDKKDVKSEVNDLEWSWVVGGGLDLDLGKVTLILDQRFFFGLRSNPFKVVVAASRFAPYGFPMDEDLVYDLDMYNYVWTASLGLGF